MLKGLTKFVKIGKRRLNAVYQSILLIQIGSSSDGNII